MPITDTSIPRVLTIAALALASITLAGCSLLPGGSGGDTSPVTTET